MSHDDLDLRGTPLGERFKSIRDTTGRDSGVQMLSRVKAELGAIEAPRVKESIVLRYSRYRAVGFGAAALVIAIAGFRLIENTRQPSGATSTKYQTAVAQRAHITLKDGSAVTLGPSSTLSVSGRNVALIGQALFTVTNHNRDPFTVTANGVLTRVLGTSFTVRAYKDDDAVRVVVAEGKVSIESKAAAPVTLSTGDIASATASHTDVEHNANVASALAWTQGRLEFKSTPLNEVVAELHKMYGWKVSIADPALGDQLFTGGITQASTRDVADMLAYVFNVRAARNGDIITLMEK